MNQINTNVAKTNARAKPLVFIVLDGWGYRDPLADNAITTAHTPCFNQLWADYPHCLLEASGRMVGLPTGQMGNSEVGHLTMGAGRIIDQDLTRIDKAIEVGAEGDFFNNPVLKKALAAAKQNKSTVHILGLLSPGGVHSHENHIKALITLVAQHNISNLFIHAFLDGRDTPPCSALAPLKLIDAQCQNENCGKIASIIGRYYAMDRDKRWDRVQKAYDLLTEGAAPFHAPNAETGLTMAYARDETDEFVQATSIHADNEKPGVIAEGDLVIFMNFRADRARELTESFISPTFTYFPRTVWPKTTFLSLSLYDERFHIPVIFPPLPLTHLFGEYISEKGLAQLRIAETEKYAHVTFFFNGGNEVPSLNEERLLVPSPKVATYDKQPEMSAYPLTDKLVEAIESGRFDVIICNFANPDMVGHTGNFDATIKAIEAIDHCLFRITDALKKVGGEVVITADHGNAEKMFDLTTQQPHTAHTTDPVPFLYVGNRAIIARPEGNLTDIAPTLLFLLGLTKPAEMTGTSLLRHSSENQ